MFKWESLLLTPLLLVMACTKDAGTNPALAYSDLSLLDSCSNSNYYYYKNDPSVLLSGSAGPHGSFKLRFNSIAYNSLGTDGKLAQGKSFPNGSMVIKDVYDGGNLTLYAYMYKKSGAWLWAEVKPNKQVLYSVTNDPGTCVNCHSQSGNRDLVVSFNFY